MSKRSERRKLAISLKLQGYSYKDIGIILGIHITTALKLIRAEPETYEAVKIRANGHCEACHTETKCGHVHHRMNCSVEEFNSMSNLIFVCISCHPKIEIFDRYNAEPQVKHQLTDEERKALYNQSFARYDIEKERAKVHRILY